VTVFRHGFDDFLPRETPDSSGVFRNHALRGRVLPMHGRAPVSGGAARTNERNTSMRMIATIGTALLALGVASTALAAFPQDGGQTPPQQGGQGGGKGGQGGGQGGGRGGPGGPGGQGGERRRPDFKTLDKNGDGFITQDEVPAEAWERLKNADKNGDGKISEEEMREARPRGPRQGGPGQGGPGQGGPGGPGQGGKPGPGGPGTPPPPPPAPPAPPSGK
jgi:hypothetical protein